MSELGGAITALRAATVGTEYEGRLWLVGGYVRDRVMGLGAGSDDIDVVLEGSAGDLAEWLFSRGVARFKPVTYPRFGTAMVVVGGGEGEAGTDVELVTARVESYDRGSRKPSEVKPGTLEDDARRRDFTINTLLENLHSGEVRDPLGMAQKDLDAGVLRTPTEPARTFEDDPLRMLRAVRFACRFGFRIEDATWRAVGENRERLGIVSGERVRDEFCKMLLSARPVRGLELLLECGLLGVFAPELAGMVGVGQNEFHVYPVWEHVLAAAGSLPDNASLTLRLATLLHDVGKPATRSVDAGGLVHFYGHEDVGAKMSHRLLQRLKFPTSEIGTVTRLVSLHMRIGEYSSAWTDAAVRRLIRDFGEDWDDLFALHRADVAGLVPGHQDLRRAVELRARAQELMERQDVRALTSPLSGLEVMQGLGVGPGKRVGEIKEFLTNEVIEGRLGPDDKDTALALARRFVEGEGLG